MWLIANLLVSPYKRQLRPISLTVFLDDSEDDSEWRLVVDLMNRLQDAAEAWFVENERSSIVLGYIDYGSTQLHISGTSLNVPLL